MIFRTLRCRLLGHVPAGFTTNGRQVRYCRRCGKTVVR